MTLYGGGSDKCRGGVARTIFPSTLSSCSQNRPPYCAFSGLGDCPNNIILSFPSPEEAQYPYIRGHPSGWTVLDTLRRGRTPRQPYSPKCSMARHGPPRSHENDCSQVYFHTCAWKGCFSASLCQAALREGAREYAVRLLKTASEMRHLRHRSASLRDLPSAIFLR
jgi:hypothetical protein